MASDPSTPQGRTIRVEVAMDTDNLRKWAEWHADHGHADVAHALYRSAERYDDQAAALDRVQQLVDSTKLDWWSESMVRAALDGDS